MGLIVRLVGAVVALALLVAVLPALRADLNLRALRVRALLGPRPSYLTPKFVDQLIAFHRQTFGFAVMAQIWDIVLPSDLTRFSREVPIPQDYLLTGPDGPLAAVVVNSIKARIRTATRTIRAAKFRAYNAENYIAGRPWTLSLQDVTLPPLGQKIPLTERELLEQAIAGGDVNDDVIQQIYDDAETNVRATRARLELAAGDVLTDGKLTLPAGENGLDGLEADWSLAVSHKPTAATLWSNGAATPLTDEQAWIQQMVADGGGRPTRAITSLQVVQYLQKNAEYRSAYWGGNAGQQPNLNLSQVNQVRVDNGLPPITIYDTAIDVDGTTTRVLPANKFILVNDGLGETQLGLTAQALTAAARANDVAFTRRDAPGIFTAAYYEDGDRVDRWTSTHAAGMPLLFDTTRLVSATVA